jgi:heme/copper-type cytochrome/quinol oxidase subunit 2
LTACGGGANGGTSHNHGSSATIAGGREVRVTAKAFSFSPSEITVRADEKVNIVLKSTDIAHDFVIDDPKFAVHAAGGKTASAGFSIDRPGTYLFYCSIAGHKSAGMAGQLVTQ